MDFCPINAVLAVHLTVNGFFPIVCYFQDGALFSCIVGMLVSEALKELGYPSMQ